MTLLAWADCYSEVGARSWTDFYERNLAASRGPGEVWYVVTRRFSSLWRIEVYWETY